MTIGRGTLLSLFVAGLLAAGVEFGVWRVYQEERAAHAHVFVVRGQAILSALEGGMRSQCRMNMWFSENVKSILEETALAEGIVGVAILDANGALLAKGGHLSETLRPSAAPQWTPEGLVVSRQARFDQSGGRHGSGGGWGRMQREESGEDPFKDPVWLVVLLEDSAYRQQVANARRQFAFSSLISMTVIMLGLALVWLIQRQGRLAAELTLARERQRRLEEMARLGAGLAHETKNPLSLIRGLAQSWQNRKVAEGESRHIAQQIIDEADQVVGRINSFLGYFRPPAPDVRAIDLGATVAETAGLFRDEAAAKGVTLDIDVAPVRVSADAGMARQVVVNLLTNALAACRSGDSIHVSAVRAGNRRWSVRVRDTGEGIAPEDLPQVTKPYFTRRKGGTGLGLAIVEQIVQSHGWRLRIESQKGRGTMVRVEGIEEASAA